MPLTVLFDLDDTLLKTNVNRFFPAYYQRLGELLSHIASQDQIKQQVHSAFHHLEANQDPSKLLSEIFDENFFPPLGTSRKACQEIIQYFVQHEYPKLQEITSPNPAAKELVSWCHSKGMTTAVATNPLFYEEINQQRVEWAGLAPKDFAFVSTMDNFHFIKPTLTYYAEALGRLGWPESGAVMIGDSPYYDISPMAIMGYPTFWVNDSSSENGQPKGALSDVKSWLENLEPSEGFSLSEEPEVHLAILRSTPAVVDSWLREIPEAVLRKKPTEDEWSVLEVLCHLADMENEVFNRQWQQVSADASEPITPPDTSRWAEERGYQWRDLSLALKSFIKARLSSLSLIEHLIEKEILHQTVQHSTLSQTKISELIGFVAKHDRIHLRQCVNLLNIYKI